MPKLSTIQSAGKFKLSKKDAQPRRYTKNRCYVIDIYYRNADDEVVTFSTDIMNVVERDRMLDKLSLGAFNVAGWQWRYYGSDRMTAAREVRFPSQLRYCDAISKSLDS